MIYNGVELDPNSKVLNCPNCNNEELGAKYCKICNTYLFNICTGVDPNENKDMRGAKWSSHNQGCKGLLDGNARFCHECGSTSSLFEDGFLKYWNEDPNENEQLVTANTSLDFLDDSLPF